VGAPSQFDYILTNPPFGSKEGKDAQAQFAYKSGKAQILFLQHIIDSLAEEGTCGMVIDEGVMFHTKTSAYKQTKRKLLNECNLWCVISLPQGVFVNAGSGAYSDPNRPPIPIQSGHLFRSIPAGYSEAFRPSSE